MIDTHTTRQWYPDDDAVHGFDHVLRVYQMAERLAAAEGADMEIVRAAALLHDAVGADPGDDAGRADHHHASADFAAQVLRREGWSEERIQAVQHCIRAHRYRSTEAPASLEAKVLFDADKLDVLGAIGSARTIAYATQAGQPAYATPSAQFIASGKKQDGEPHSAYHEYLFKLRNVRARLQTASAQAIADQRHDFMVSFFEQLAAECEGQR